ncbi:MAG: ribosome biogenesis GTP-binding protein YihA/YsxC [Proteobacteria bacterium]|nr:ribosome biogenesis GTP-binding protein YihA/YsxC [Pseudomonadota bacterium]
MEARFLTAAGRPDQFPDHDRIEIAFAGRSNVGKSSLINRLLNRRKLVRTSSTPGRTREINYFIVGDDLCFVDLPGYGYAKVPKKMQAAWRPLVEAYLTRSKNLALVILLMDPRREPGQGERDLLSWLTSAGRPCQVVFTKVDKLKKSQVKSRLDKLSADLGGPDLPPLPFSTLSGLGKDRLWERIRAATRTGG